jgi:hypothetical protein
MTRDTLSPGPHLMMRAMRLPPAAEPPIDRVRVAVPAAPWTPVAPQWNGRIETAVDLLCTSLVHHGVQKSLPVPA